MNSKIFKQLQESKDYISRTFHISKIGIFGSHSRGEENCKSDIDILVEYNRIPDFIEYIKAEMYLENLLQKKVDLVEINSIRSELEKEILSEVFFI